MTDEKWRQIWTLYDAASGMESGRRTVFLERAGGDLQVIQRVRAMLDGLPDAEPGESIFEEIGEDGLASGGRAARVALELGAAGGGLFAAEGIAQDGLAVRRQKERPPQDESPPHVAASDDTVADPRLGKQIGQYCVTGFLGRGGSSTVYSGRDTMLDRNVALKFLSLETPGASNPNRFLREARTASALNHPNILTTYEVIRTGDAIVIVTELVDGIVLRNLCGVKRPPEQVASIGRQIAEALAAAHGSGIIHRDVKPENIVVRPDGYVKLLDFGLARRTAVDWTTLDAMPAGTLRYMSPEQLRGEKLSGATDIFSLGLMLFELAAGSHPLSGYSTLDGAVALQRETLPNLLERNPAFPAKWAAAISAMLAKNPESRPSARDVVNVFSSGSSPESLQATSSSAARPVKRWAIGTLITCFLLVCLMAGWIFLKKDTRVTDAGAALLKLEPKPFTSFNGSETLPTFSPDGRQIAFVWDGDDGTNSDIYVKLVGPGKPLRLTTNPAVDTEPAWSPDGMWIAFLRQERPGGPEDILLIPALGGAERKVGELGPVAWFARKIAWWPDSKALIIADNDAGSGPLFRLSVDTGERSQLTHPKDGLKDSRQVVSPDGRNVAFTRETQTMRTSICVLKVAGGAEQCVTELGVTPDSLAWSLDSRAMIFSLTDQPGTWLLPVSGGKPAKIAETTMFDLAFSPAAQRLAFTQSYTDSNIWRISLETGVEEPLIMSSKPDVDPEYSPDGKRIVFESARSGAIEIWVADANGHEQTQLTTIGDAGSPRWSPDGTKIAFDSGKQGTFANVWLVASTGGAATRVTSDRFNSYLPAWSRDGSWIYFASDEGGKHGLWKMRPDGAEPTRVADSPVLDLFEAPNKELYFTKRRTTAGIWKLPLSGGQPQVLPGTESIHAVRYWTLAGNDIYFVDNSGRPVLQVYNLQTGSTRKIAALNHKIVMGDRGLAVSPDKKWVLCTFQDLAMSDIMLVENFR